MLKILRLLPHLTVTMFRATNSRWYYFRDRPDWVVEWAAGNAIQDGHTAVVAAWIREARAEQYRRTDQVARRAEASGHQELADQLRGLNDARRVHYINRDEAYRQWRIASKRG